MTTQKTSSSENPSASDSSSSVNNPTPSKSGRWLWFWVGMTGLAMLSATAGAQLATFLPSAPLMQARLTPEQEAVFDSDRISGTGLQFSELTRPVNVLLLGMSVLPPDVKNPPPESTHLRYQPEINSFDGLSDVMLLLRFDPQKKKLAILSIPRDTRAEVNGHGIEKINAANVDGGPALTATAVSNLLNGVGIDRYVRINVLGLAKLIDALGGVTVYVPKDMKYQDDSQHLYINLKAGKQHLNGDQAMQLLRYRHDELGDIGRIQRQQVVLRALMDQSLNPATLTQLPKILNVIKDHIDTNLTVEELVALVGFGGRTNRSNMQMLMIPGRFSERNEYNTSYWLPDKERIASLTSKHFDVESPRFPQADTARTVRIAIQDSTDNPRAVRSLAIALEKAGYRNVYVGKRWGEPLETTHIVAQQGDGESAEAVRNALKLGEVRVESTGNLQSDVSIQLGKDWLQRQPR